MEITSRAAEETMKKTEILKAATARVAADCPTEHIEDLHSVFASMTLEDVADVITNYRKMKGLKKHVMKFFFGTEEEKKAMSPRDKKSAAVWLCQCSYY